MSYRIPDHLAKNLIRISEVSKLTGIRVLTLRNWEKRYGVPMPARTIGGQRLYPLSEIELLKVAKSRLDLGERPGQVLPTLRQSIFPHHKKISPKESQKGAIACLIYASEPSQTLTQAELTTMIKKAAFANNQNGVTGVLLKTPQFYMQCIEGHGTSLNLLYKKLLMDPRHSNVHLLYYSTQEKRSFPDWSMQLITLKDLNKKVLAQWSLHQGFSPFELQGNQAFELLTQFKGSPESGLTPEIST